jgi:nucleoside-diphosphate-sugar epimerase
MALNIPGQGFLGNFLRKALLRETIEIFGDGRQLRDPVYADDATDAFLRAGAIDDPPSRLWNLGGSESLPLSRIAEVIASAAGAPAPRLRPFPEDHKSIDIGSYATDSTKIRTELGWQPRVSFEEGIRQAIAYYRGELPHYLSGWPVSTETDSAAGPAPSTSEVPGP